MENPRLKILNAKALNTPELPGVYIMHNKSKKIIYIGKAKILKNRVSQYFREGERHDLKVQKMVENVYDFDYVVCTSEFEALILECSLIKQHQPKYNILLKDDKGYHYIKVTNETWPKITSEKQVLDDGATYIGPYDSGFSVMNTVDEVDKIFMLPKCSKIFPRDIGRGRPCLNFSIGLCCAPCAGKISQAEYTETVRNALKYLKNGKNKSIQSLTEQMQKYSDDLEFEKAAKIRDRIKAIERVSEKQHIYASKVPEQDVIAFARTADSACFEVFRFSDGRFYDREHYFVDISADEEELRAEFLKSYYLNNGRIPPQITLDGKTSDAAIIEKWLSEKSGKTVHIVVPQKGEQYKLVEMCRSNAAERLIQRSGYRKNAVLDELAVLLGLSASPLRIEAYDISHTAGESTVGAMVVFKEGKPYKSDYRRFKIDSLNGPDDYAAMSEVLTRRFNEYLKNKETDRGFGKLPDLILLDGGVGQLSCVTEVMRKFGISVPVFGMVKDDKHKTRALVGSGGEVQIKETRNIFTLISSVQDEVHRFAIDYHHKRQKSKSFSLQLEKIEGVGKKRAAELLFAFGGIEKIAQSSEDDLCKVKGITKPIAKNIIAFFKK